MKHITPTEAYELQQSNPDALLIDVRSEIVRNPAEDLFR